MKMKTNKSRRDFLKILGVGATTALTASVLPVVKTGGALSYEAVPKSEIPKETAVKDIQEFAESLGPGLPRYLRQKKTGRIYVYTDELARRDDMILLEPPLPQVAAEIIRAILEGESIIAEKLRVDIMAMQKLEAS